jgi:UDP-N-acetylmuramoyl-L-alanyl-D-glutamate--2,6-diaminopimelate ligase
MDDYMAAKMRLFDTLLPKGAPAVIFADDPWSEKAVAVAERAGARVLTVGRKGGFLSLKRVEHLRDKQIAEVHMDGRIFEVHLPLAGDFQVSNALVAAGMAIASGTSADQAMAALDHLSGASGRLELVGRRQRARPPMSIMPTSPRRWKTCWRPCGLSPPAGWSWCSVAAATATAASGRSWARSRRGWPTW